uniref:Putative alternative splicing factor n=1 Tax=Ixodes ricinus TaxID=34613 RepID=V5H4R1_IXORI
MTTRVFIGHLSCQVREKDLDKFFKGYGRVGDIHLKNGFGFVEFDDHRDARRCHIRLERQRTARRTSISGVALRKQTWTGGKNRAVRVPTWRSPPPRRPFAPRDTRFGPPQRTEYQLIVENRKQPCQLAGPEGLHETGGGSDLCRCPQDQT